MLKQIFIFIVFVVMSSQSFGQLSPKNLKNGDFLLRSKASSLLGSSIDAVTQTKKGTHYSHIGIVEIQGKQITVLHASMEGTCVVSLASFFSDDGQQHSVDVYRLKPQYRKYISDALVRGHQMLGKPYNYSYILSDSAYYCSDFVYRCFEPDSVFRLNPMTFVDPKTGKTAAGWVKYYQKLGISVPEGKLGCNPNGMAANSKLERIGKLIIPEK